MSMRFFVLDYRAIGWDGRSRGARHDPGGEGPIRALDSAGGTLPVGVCTGPCSSTAPFPRRFVSFLPGFSDGGNSVRHLVGLAERRQV